MILASLVVAAILAGAVGFQASRLDGDWKRGPVFVPALLLPALGLLAWQALTTPVYGLDEEWNGCRLAPVVSLTRGYALYYPQHEGPILNNIYGPLGTLAYFPVLAFRTASSIVVTGVAVAVLFLLVPLFACHWRARGAGSESFLRAMLAGAVTFVALSLHYGTRYWYSKVHADAPALGFGLLACACLIRTPSRRALILAGLFTSLALFSKQTSIGLPLGIAAYLALAYGGRPLLTYAAGVVGFSAAIGLASLAIFGAGPLSFNTIGVPGRHPWQEPGAVRPVWLLTHFGPPAALLLPGLIVLGRLVRADRRRLRPECAGRPWTLFVLVALFMTPTSLLGLVKVGGETNSLHAVLYLYVAASLSLVQSTAEAGRAQRPLQYGFAALAAGLLFAGGYLQAAQLRTPESLLADNPYRQADAFWRRHPGEVYFPTNPLCTLLAESRLYHFDYGVYDRTLAGCRPSPEHVRAHVPTGVRYLAFRRFPPRVMADYLPAFQSRRGMADPTMYDWTIYAAGP